MGYYDDEFYWEPSEADILFEEIKNKIIDTAKDSLKSEIESLKSENAYLKKCNNEFKKKISEIEQKERDLKYKAENLEREVKEEFYKKHIQDVIEEWLEKAEVWYAEDIPYDKPKCNLCDENREWSYTFPDGYVAKRMCTCNYKNYVYEPRLSEAPSAKFHKTYVKESRWGHEVRAYLRKSYQPNRDFAEAYDCYGEFYIDKVFDQFDEDTKEYHKNKRYGERLAFKDKNECQKYCDWLNKQRKDR